MNRIYAVKLKLAEGAPEKKQTYLVGAVSFTDAEVMITDEVISQSSDDSVSIESITKPRVYDIYEYSDDVQDTFFYLAKVMFEEERKFTASIYIQAPTLDAALSRLQDNIGDSIMDYEITSITKSDVVGVIRPASEEVRSIVVESEVLNG